jgi:hypothetical protein
LADHEKRLTGIEQARQKENLEERMALQEQNAATIGKRLDHIDEVQGKIFERINQLADKR